MKNPVYNPIAMGSQVIANAYGKACEKINKRERIKRCQDNRDRLLTENK